MLITMTFKAALTAAAAGVALAAPVQAQDRGAAGTRAESPVVVERADNGRATSVRIGETVYKVCATENEDGCIQPRAAGLDWGDRPLQSWPGRPASEMNGRDRAAATPGG